MCGTDAIRSRMELYK